jgi:hypothetical protein
METRIISLWSGPRNVSTALMYSFAQRQDTRVVDEPLYAYYLLKSDAIHPGREEVIASMSHDPEEIWNSLQHTTSPVMFIKNMAHHAIDLPAEWYYLPEPVLLIRDPRQMLPSLKKQIPDPILRDTGLADQQELLHRFLELGKKPVVIDSRQLLLKPEMVLKRLCEKLGIHYEPTMLNWKAGALDEDGIWAKYWYHRVHKSTGFEPYKEKTDPFPDELKELLDICQPIYDELLTYAIDEEKD